MWSFDAMTEFEVITLLLLLLITVGIWDLVRNVSNIRFVLTNVDENIAKAERNRLDGY